jgi:hypothetical protein
MRLLRYGIANEERPGLLDSEGCVRDLSGYIPDVTPAVLSDSSLQRLATIHVKSLIELGVEHLGTQKHVVHSWDAASAKARRRP